MYTSTCTCTCQWTILDKMPRLLQYHNSYSGKHSREKHSQIGRKGVSNLQPGQSSPQYTKDTYPWWLSTLFNQCWYQSSTIATSVRHIHAAIVTCFLEQNITMRREEPGDKAKLSYNCKQRISHHAFSHFIPHGIPVLWYDSWQVLASSLARSM